jgi:hypothetical protein
MKRSDLEHIIRASSAIAEDQEIIAVGSQAILGQYPGAPVELLRSVELDVFPKNHPERSIVIDGAIGEQSVFHQTFGYYAHGVGPDTAILPIGWEERLIVVQNENTGGAIGLCLEAHDLAASKLAAGREKDIEFVSALLRHKLARRKVLEERVGTLNVDSQVKESLAKRLVTLL